MAARLVVWLSASVLAAGLTVATIAGAGLAVADDGATSGTDSAASQPSNPTGVEADSDTAKSADMTPDDATGDPDADAEDHEAAEPDITEGEEVTEEDDEEEVTDDGARDDNETKSGSDDRATARTFLTDRDSDEISDRTERSAEGLEKVARATEESEESTFEPAAADSGLAPVAAAVEDEILATFGTESAPADARVAMTAVAEEPAAGPSLINIVGTLAWSVLDFVVKLVDLPPAVPASSSVTAGRSTLQIDCGDGYTADADWYYPKDGQPEKLIYFQHGFPARAFVYDVTLRELAERNNAIVVAPSITSNYFACDGCSLTADPMHEAVAHLFDGDRAALLASARAAGFEGSLPEKFVLAGQSAGTMLAAGGAGYYYEKAQAEGQEPDLLGVLLFDGSAANGALARALDKLPLTVPVLNIAAEPVVFNYYGAANQLLSVERPGQFNGVQLINGAHSDGFRSNAYFGVVQAIVAIGFGASAPENAEAVQVLSEGWLTDMYAGRVYDPMTRTGIYGTPGQPGAVTVDIPTDAGLAHGYVLPAPPYALSAFEQFFAAVVHSINSNDFATCSTEPTTASCSEPAPTEI